MKSNEKNNIRLNSERYLKLFTIKLAWGCRLMSSEFTIKLGKEGDEKDFNL